MATDSSAPQLDGLLSEDSQDVEALELLEARVLDMVQQLRDARGRQQAAEQESVRLRAELAEKSAKLTELETLANEGQSSRKVVKSRIESLLERIETIEQG